MEVFQAWYDYNATKPDELTIKVNDEVIVLDKSGGDWWLGRNRRTNEEGWFPKDYGEIKGSRSAKPLSPPQASKLPGSPGVGVDSALGLSSPTEMRNPYLKVRAPRSLDSSTTTFRNKEEAFLELVASEERYLNSLKTFVENFLESVLQRDCEEKRKLCYGHKNVAVALELTPVLLALNARLLESLKAAGSDTDAVARAILAFAPANKVYALYAANQLDVPAGLEKLGTSVAKWLKDNPLPGGMTLLRYLTLPVERMPLYHNFLAAAQRFVKDHALFATAVKTMEEGLDLIEDTVAEHERQAQLVDLQAQFMGYVDLYGPHRALVKEGTLKKIYIDNSGRKPQDRHAHLFNDAIIYSSKLIGPYKYKLAKSFDLSLISQARVLPQDPTMFDLLFAEEGHDTIRLQASDEQSAHEWAQLVNKQVEQIKARLAWDAAHGKPQQPRETRVNIIAFLKQQGLDVERLPERSKHIVYGLKADFTYAEYIKVFARTVAMTLDEIGRGIGSASAQEFGEQAERGKGLFDTKTKAYTQATEGTMNRMKAAAATKPLQSAEMGLFLKLVPIIADLTAAMVDSLEGRLEAHAKAGQDLVIGPVYLDLAAVFKSYELYASVLFEAIDLLASPTFAELVGAMSEELAPLTIEQHLQAPMDAARRMAAWLQGVLEMTPEDHPDHRYLEAAVALAEKTVANMAKNEQDVKDYWRLVAVRESITSYEFKDTRLDTLINNTRKMVHEGVLTKVCRGKNKQNMFWLFNDALIYATHMPGGSYTFNRWMDLTEMRVEENSSERMGLDILTASKSFTVLCLDETDKAAWKELLQATILSAKEAAGIDPSKESWQAAPVLVQTTERNDCTICHEKFSFFKPKHHCLKCGIIVCDRCSPNRMTLPNIHKTQKQRVCNTCLNGIGNDTPAPAPEPRAAPVQRPTPPAPAPAPVPRPAPEADLLSSPLPPAPSPARSAPPAPAPRTPVKTDWLDVEPAPPVAFQPRSPAHVAPSSPVPQQQQQFASPGGSNPFADSWAAPPQQQPAQPQYGYGALPPKQPTPTTTPAAFDAFDAIGNDTLLHQAPVYGGYTAPSPQPQQQQPAEEASSNPFDF